MLECDSDKGKGFQKCQHFADVIGGWCPRRRLSVPIVRFAFCQGGGRKRRRKWSVRKANNNQEHSSLKTTKWGSFGREHCCLSGLSTFECGFTTCTEVCWHVDTWQFWLAHDNGLATRLECFNACMRAKMGILADFDPAANKEISRAIKWGRRPLDAIRSIDPSLLDVFKR